MSNTTIIAIRVKKEDKVKLEQLAKEDKRSLSNYIKIKLELL